MLNVHGVAAGVNVLGVDAVSDFVNSRSAPASIAVRVATCIEHLRV